MSAGEQDLRYSYRASPMGGPLTIALAPDAIEWDAGRRNGRMLYRDVKRVRMTFRPATMQMHRFMTEVWGPGGKVTVLSASWRGIAEQQRQDAAYCEFISEMHTRIARAGAVARYEAGFHWLFYGVGLVVAVAAGLGLAGLTVKTLLVGAYVPALIAGGFLAAFLWQSYNYVRRNRPTRYEPDNLPPQLSP